MTSVPISLILELSEYNVGVQNHRQEYHQTLEFNQTQGILDFFSARFVVHITVTT